MGVESLPTAYLVRDGTIYEEFMGNKYEKME